MPKLPHLSGAEIVRALTRLGFAQVIQKGSQVIALTCSGICLVLCRQIAENHGGTLTLENRPDATGCVARLRLPA